MSQHPSWKKKLALWATMGRIAAVPLVIVLLLFPLRILPPKPHPLWGGKSPANEK